MKRLGKKYGKCTPDDVVWQDLREGQVVTIDNERYDRKVNDHFNDSISQHFSRLILSAKTTV